MSTYLITGGAGFIGSHLAQALTAQGHKVRVLDNLSSGSLRNLQAARRGPGEFSFVEGDIRDPQACREAVEGVDYVLHQAAKSRVQCSLDDPLLTHEVNATGSLNLLWAAKGAGVKRVVAASSSSIYGDVEPMTAAKTEDLPPNPMSPYAVSKVAQDLLGLQYHLTHKLDVVRVRPFNHIGPRQRIGFVAPDFASQVAKVEAGLQPPVMEVGNLEARRDFSDVRDVVRAYHLLVMQGKAGEVYNVGSGESHAVQDILDTLLSMTDVEIEVRQDPKRMRPSDVPEVVCDATRIRQDTGWQPTISFEQSLADVLNFWRQEIKKQAEGQTE